MYKTVLDKNVDSMNILWFCSAKPLSIHVLHKITDTSFVVFAVIFQWGVKYNFFNISQIIEDKCGQICVGHFWLKAQPL